MRGGGRPADGGGARIGRLIRAAAAALLVIAVALPGWAVSLDASAPRGLLEHRPAPVIPTAIGAASQAPPGRGSPAARPGSGQRALARFIGDDSLRIVYWADDRRLAERVWRTASRSFHLPGLPAGASRIRGTIFLAPDPAAYDSLTRGAPEWSAGVAIPSRRQIVVPAFASRRTPGGDPLSALRHEIAHLALHDYLPLGIPRWFDEGYATWASGEWDEGAGWRIRLAMLRRDAPLLDSLTLEWPRLAPQAELAYLLSASAVRHLASRGSGEPAFTAFLAAWRREGSFDAAMRSVYQTTPGEFERDWRAMVTRRYGWLLALSQAGVFWLVVTVLFLLLGTARRRYDRARMEQLRVEDRVLAPPEAGEEGWATHLDAPADESNVDRHAPGDGPRRPE